MKKIILASQSPRRSELLKQLNIPFEKFVSSVDEQAFSYLEPKRLVQTLAYEKAKDVSKQLNEPALIIGADTVVVYKQQILGKPADLDEAQSYLEQLSGQMHYVYSGIAILNLQTSDVFLDYCETRVYMRTLLPSDISAYIKTGEPSDKAGAYAIQGFGASLIQKIDGDYTNVVGLPVSKLIEGLNYFGVNYFNTYL